MESYGRRVATLKPLLTEAQKKVRLAWAIEHSSWNPEHWAQVVWTDECSFSTEGFGKVYVTRQPEEKYNESCCAPKFRTYSSWTIHGSISAFGKGDIPYPTVSLPDPASLPLRETPPEPHYNHNLKINSRAMVLEFCIEVL